VRLGFIRLSSFERIIRQAARTLDKTSNKARSDIRAVVADVSVNLREVAL
jgi:F0F1-type ATP synthase membrane subunit b/b'